MTGLQAITISESVNRGPYPVINLPRRLQPLGLLVMTPYQRYLQSDHWKQLREAKLKACGSSCNRCTSTNDIQVHHVYYKKSWWECELADLEVLCRECHEKAHRIQKKALKKVFIKYKNFHAFDHAFRRCDTRICARY